MPKAMQHDSCPRILIARNARPLLRLYYAGPVAQRLRGVLSDTPADRARFVAGLTAAASNDDGSPAMSEPTAMEIFDAFAAMARTAASGQGSRAEDDCLAWICKNLLEEPVVPRVEDLERMGAAAASLLRR